MTESPEQLRQLSPEDYANIRELLAEHSVGLDKRLASYRRRVKIRRYTVATCIFMGCCISYSSAVAVPKYNYIISTSQADSQHICETIHNALCKI